MLGRWDEALARAAEADELAATEFAEGLGLAAVLIHARRGALERARELMALHAGVGRSENPDFSAGWAALDAQVLAMEGRPGDAFAQGRRALDILRAAGGIPNWALFGVFDAASLAADAEEIRGLLAVPDDLGMSNLSPGVRAQQARLRARLPEYDAESELATAERLFAELGAPFDLAVVQLEHVEWLAAQGRATQAEPLLAEAQETFERLEARPWVARAAQALSPERHAQAVT